MNTPPEQPAIAVPDSADARAAREATAALQGRGHTAYWAGGCVRDLLLGRTPKDYDVATSAAPDAVAQLFPEAVFVGRAFGVIRARVAGCWLEIATFRRDSTYQDGRRPVSVEFADAPQDAQRRDFTVNAMFYDPVAGRLHDYVGGVADLADRLIRCVGDPELRLAEDHLRLLRAARFAATLGFAIEPHTEDAIRRLAPSLAKISGERVRDELTRILTESPAPGRAVLRLRELGLLAVILPEVDALAAQAQPPEFHPEGDVLTHTALMLDAMAPPTPHLAYAVLLHDVGKPATARQAADRLRFHGHAEEGARLAGEILRRLRFANDDIDTIVRCVRDHMRFIDVQDMRTATVRRLVGSPTFPIELELHRLDCVASHGKLDNYAFLLEFRDRLAAEPVLPAPLVSGRDVLALGVPEGPEVGRWLRAAYEAQLDGRFADREALRAWLRAQLAVAGPAAMPGDDAPAPP